MATLHYPPWRDNDSLLSVTDQKNPCLYLLYSKLGMPSDNPTELICWTERFYIMTDLKDRELNDARPYEAVHNEATCELNAQLNRKIDNLATYFVRLFVGKENVEGDAARVKADKDWVPFTLTFDKGDFVPIYRQPYHGAVNVKTAQFHLYGYHPEPILRGNLDDKFLHLADMTVNLFAALLDINSVRPKAFEMFKTSNITDDSLWKSDNGNGKHNDTLKAVIMMRWVEKNHDYRFSLDQLSQSMLYYAEKEGLVLDDNAEDSPVLQINRHISRKAGNSSASIIMPDGTKFVNHIARKGHATQAANGFPQLVALHVVERELGWPTLNRGRETQRAGNWAGLRKTVENRVAAQRKQLQEDVEATNKRKREEDPTFEPPVLRGPQPTTQWVNKSAEVKCPKCPKKLTEGGLKRHMTIAHSAYSPETPYKCKLGSCNRYFPRKGAADQHYNTVHGSKSVCPECSKEFVASYLDKHRRDQHGLTEEEL